ncbi:3948_t:CDS:2, partial [Acaulospora colombiana]
MASSSLVVPLALWNRLPTAPVTVVVYREGHVVTGLKDGHIWIYRCTVNDKGDLQLQHKVLCIGHKSTITALTIIEGSIDGCAGNNYILLSASEDGWPTKFILCTGFLNEITILNCATLEVVRIWAGHNDWVTCTPFYDS